MRPASRIQHRRATAAEWTAENPVLRAGEMGIESDTGKIKFGDGVTAWSSLAAAGPKTHVATVDFGSISNTNASVTVTGLSWVTADTVFSVSVVGETSDHASAEEGLIDRVRASVGSVVAGTGFTVYAHAPEGTTGTYDVHVIGVG